MNETWDTKMYRNIGGAGGALVQLKVFKNGKNAFEAKKLQLKWYIMLMLLNSRRLSKNENQFLDYINLNVQNVV